MEQSERRAVESLGHRIEGKRVTVDRDDRQTDAVDRDRVSDCRSAGRLGRVELEPHALGIARERRHRSNLTDEPREHPVRLVGSL